MGDWCQQNRGSAPRKVLVLVIRQVVSRTIATKYASIFTIQRWIYIKEMSRNSLVHSVWFILFSRLKQTPCSQETMDFWGRAGGGGSSLPLPAPWREHYLYSSPHSIGSWRHSNNIIISVNLNGSSASIRIILVVVHFIFGSLAPKSVVESKLGNSRNAIITRLPLSQHAGCTPVPGTPGTCSTRLNCR